MLKELIVDGFMPHGSCLLWREDLLLLYVAGDSLTFVSYFLIPLGLVQLVKQRDDLEFDWIFIMFAAFIFFCGITHMMGLINIWHSYYYVEGTAKVATGLVSATTAFMLWKLMPRALAIPSRHELAARHHELVQIKRQLEESNRLLEQRVAERTRELERLATTDALTQLFNRGEILRLAHLERARSARYGHVFSLLMIDVDRFKAINDDLGHPAGDTVLAEVAAIIRNNCRLSDHAGRYGGEEFLVICPETAQSEACCLADRIRHDVEALRLDGIRPVTCSLGVGTFTSGQTLEALIAVADQALYKAKHDGRNRVVCLP